MNLGYAIAFVNLPHDIEVDSEVSATVGAVPPSTPSTPKKKKRRRLRNFLAGLIIAAAGSGLTITLEHWWPVGNAASAQVTSASPSPVTLPPPQVTLDSVSWPPGRAGLFEVRGDASYLRMGQVLWVFNQPVEDNVGGTIYPGPSACPVDQRGEFDCTLDWAGAPTEGGTTFNIIVAIVSDAQAYDYAQEKAGIASATQITKADQLPRVGAYSVHQSKRTN